MLFLSNDDVERVLTMAGCMAALEDAYLELAAGRAVNQLRYDTNMPLPERPERQARYEFKTMVGILPKAGVAALRMSSTLNHRPVIDGAERMERLHAGAGGTIVGLVQLYSTVTGEPMAFMQDGVLQGMRVGGTYGLALKHLARPDAAVMGLLGTGHQARYQVAAAMVARRLRRLKIYSPNRAHRQEFAAEMTATHDLEVLAVDSTEQAVEGVDIVVAATNAKQPIVTADMIVPGMHVAALQNEISPDAASKVDVRVEHSTRPYTICEGGPGTGQYGRPVSYLPAGMEQQGLPQLEDLIAGKVTGRTRPDEVTMFRTNSGLGIQFAAVGAQVYEAARRAGLGRELPREWFLQTLHT